MTTFFNIFKKPKKIPIFWVKNVFLENPALSRTTSSGFLASCQNLEKTNNKIPRKCPDRRKDRPQKDQEYCCIETVKLTCKTGYVGVLILPIELGILRHSYQLYFVF